MRRMLTPNSDDKARLVMRLVRVSAYLLFKPFPPVLVQKQALALLTTNRGLTYVFRMACLSRLSLQVRRFWRASGLGLKLRVIYAINGNP